MASSLRRTLVRIVLSSSFSPHPPSPSPLGESGALYHIQTSTLPHHHFIFNHQESHPLLFIKTAFSSEVQKPPLGDLGVSYFLIQLR